MPDKKLNTIRPESFVEKLIRRTLETVGGSVDRLFGRGRKPDALPQTHDLGERLRKMIDQRAQVNQSGRKLAPHLIRLKYAWGQSSDEFLAALKKLENELLLVALDHINDYRYATLAPVKIESKADILTEGFAMSLGFDEADLQESEAVAIPVEIYAKLLPPEFQTKPTAKPSQTTIKAVSMLPNGVERKAHLTATVGEKTNFIVGRLKECDLYLDDQSVSKHHASLVFNWDGTLKVADVGSTNGTFLDGKRIAYGKAFEITAQSTVAFGDVKVRFDWEMPQPEIAAEPTSAENTALNQSADGALKIGVASMKRGAAVEILEESTAAKQETAADARKLADDEDEITVLDRSRAAPQTFFDSKLADDEAPQTFVDAELTDSEKTFIDEELRAQSGANSTETSKSLGGEQLSGAAQTFVDAKLKTDGAQDFTQSLPRLDDAADSGRTAESPLFVRQNAEKTTD